MSSLDCLATSTLLVRSFGLLEHLFEMSMSEQNSRQERSITKDTVATSQMSSFGTPTIVVSEASAEPPQVKRDDRGTWLKVAHHHATAHRNRPALPLEKYGGNVDDTLTTILDQARFALLG